MEKRVLAVFPHPDDESFGVSGTLAMYAASGAEIAYACLTLGEMGRNMGFPPFANRETLPGFRRKELEASCRAIGIRDLRLLGFMDKTIEFEDPDLLDGRIAEVVRDVRPELVVTFYPGYAVHPDHDACGAAVVRVIGRMPRGERPVVHCLAFSRGCEQVLGKPDVLRDVRPYLKQKFDSIRAHRSQFYVPGISDGSGRVTRELEERFGTERFWTYRFD